MHISICLAWEIHRNHYREGRVTVGHTVQPSKEINGNIGRFLMGMHCITKGINCCQFLVPMNWQPVNSLYAPLGAMIIRLLLRVKSCILFHAVHNFFFSFFFHPS